MAKAITEASGGALSPEQEELDRLLLRIAAEDREALGELYRRTKGAVYGAALGVLKNACDAQEITQDVFVRIWEKAGQYRRGGSPMNWILALARNLALMRLRREARYGALSDAEWDAIPAEAGRVTPEDRDVLQTALAALADGERQIVLLHAAGLTFPEIAETLGLLTATARSKHHRAIEKMRARLEGGETP